MNSVDQADLVLHGGKIWTGYGNPVAEAIAVLGNKVLASGSDAAIKALIGPGTKVVDLAGRFAMPGLNDAHLHLISTGLLPRLPADPWLPHCRPVLPKPRKASGYPRADLTRPDIPTA
jgi:predicted amidohydrolase YtcJ